MSENSRGNILITGASGMIGSALSKHLQAAGFTPYHLERSNAETPFHYNGDRKQITLDPTIPLHAVINLAGANIAEKRWTPARKKIILESRTDLTKALAQALAAREQKPKIFLSASAIGYYGDTGNVSADESSPAGSDFLAMVATQWEQATVVAQAAGINTVHLRFGIVLDTSGGVLKQLLLPFKLGLGGRIGSGAQYMSWISLADVLQIIERLVIEPPRTGPINLVSNEPVSNLEFSKQLGRALHRPAVIPLPAAIVKLLFGEMADALLLGSSKIYSREIQRLGIELQHPSLSTAFTSTL